MSRTLWNPPCGCKISQLNANPAGDYTFTHKCQEHAAMSDAEARHAILTAPQPEGDEE
jgi:hypothetical protein